MAGILKVTFRTNCLTCKAEVSALNAMTPVKGVNKIWIFQMAAYLKLENTVHCGYETSYQLWQRVKYLQS